MVGWLSDSLSVLRIPNRRGNPPWLSGSRSIELIGGSLPLGRGWSLKTELYASRFNRIFPEINRIQSIYSPLLDNAKQKGLFLVG